MHSRNKTKVSVIIPVFNVAGYIEACLRSVIRQSLSELEIIVVNDGSTDGSGEVVKKVMASDSRVVLLSKPNGGVTSAREMGLRHATGEYIFYLDGDDCLHAPNSLAIMLAKAEATDADFVAGDFRIVFADDKCAVKHFCPYDTHNSREALRYAFLNNDFYYTGRLIRKKCAVLLLGQIPKDITYGEDTYAIVNLLSQINTAAKVDCVILDYVQRASSVTNRFSKHDLEKRNRATNLTIHLVTERGIEQYAEDEIAVFALKEIYQSITLGCPNHELASKYLRKIKTLKCEYRCHLSHKTQIVLRMASINMSLTFAMLSGAKYLRNLLR